MSCSIRWTRARAATHPINIDGVESLSDATVDVLLNGGDGRANRGHQVMGGVGDHEPGLAVGVDEITFVGAQLDGKGRAGAWGNRERHAVAGDTADTDDDTASSRACGDRHDDARRAPTGDRCGLVVVERDAAGTLRRAEVRAGDSHRSADGTGSGTQHGDVGPGSGSHGEGRAVASDAADRYDDGPSGCTRRNRRSDGSVAPTGGTRRRPVERYNARSLRCAKLRSGDR